MGSRENFSIFISNLGGNYAVELQNGEIREFFLQSSNNFLEKFFASGGINCNYSLRQECRTSRPEAPRAAHRLTANREERSNDYNVEAIDPTAARVGRKSAAPSASRENALRCTDALTHQALARLVPPLPRCGRGALRLWLHSPSPAPRERVASAARRVRVRRRPNFLRAWCARGALVTSPNAGHRRRQNVSFQTIIVGHSPDTQTTVSGGRRCAFPPYACWNCEKSSRSGATSCRGITRPSRRVLRTLLRMR
jgi:hypothetical protein